MSRRILAIALFLFSHCAHSMVRFNSAPQSPCPSVFQYRRDLRGNYGEISIPNDGNSVMVLNVNVSLTGLYNNDLSLRLQSLTPTNELLTSRFLLYRLDFPVQNVIPKIVQILYNGNIYCSGPPENLGPSGVTNLWSSLRTSVNQINYPVIQESPPQTHQIDHASTAQTPPRTETSHTPIPQIITSTNAPIVDTSSCGLPIDIRTLVANGNETEQDEFPWLVALFYRSGISYYFKCTTNLITNQHVVTAGHCVQYYNALLHAKEDIILVLERHDLTHWAIGSTIRQVAQISVHPDYKERTAHYDIAVIKMDKTVEFKVSLRPICLWQGDDTLKPIVGSSGTVAGWGKDEKGHEVVPKPRKVAMPIVSQEQCLRSNPNFYNITSTVTFCAGNRDGSGPCNGDSGAGLIMNINGRFYLRGIVSTALRVETDMTCDLNEYIVFMDVAKVTTWIYSVTQ